MNKSKNAGLRLKKTTLASLGAGKVSLNRFGRLFPPDVSCLKGFGVHCAPDGERGRKPEMNQDKMRIVSLLIPIGNSCA